MRISFYLLVLSSLSLAATPTAGNDVGKLSLSGYLGQVKNNHEGVKGYEASAKAGEARASEGSLMYSPNLFFEGKVFDDSKRTNNPAFMGTRTAFDSLSLGVSQVTSFGLAGRLYYTTAYTQIFGVDPNFFPQPQFWESKPVLELSQSFWRNGFGAETVAAVEAMEAGAKSGSFMSQFQAQLVFVDAEIAYWRLQGARQTVELQKESLARAVKIKEWNARRANMQLADRSDLYQAEAGLKFRELELRASQDQAEAAARAFNSLRGNDKADVGEQLVPLSEDLVNDIKPSAKLATRADVKAAEEMKKAAAANARLGEQKNSPNLDLQGSFALNGRDTQLGNSINTSLGTGFPTWAVALNFKTPLDIGGMSNYREAYVKEREGAELQYRRKLFEQEREWKDLNERLADARRRFTIADELEAIQKQKLDHERDRLKRGQSVTYQVLLFEQDYLSSQLMRIRTMEEILSIAARMKIFGGNS